MKITNKREMRVKWITVEAYVYLNTVCLKTGNWEVLWDKTNVFLQNSYVTKNRLYSNNDTKICLQNYKYLRMETMTRVLLKFRVCNHVFKTASPRSPYCGTGHIYRRCINCIITWLIPNDYPIETIRLVKKRKVHYLNHKRHSTLYTAWESAVQ
jgi:hypothetical protein